MLPTYEPGETVTINKVTRDTSPEIGDVVLIHPPAGANTGGRCGVPREPGEACSEPVPELDEDVTFIKRVVATGGDVFYMDTDGEPVVNGHRLDQTWETVPCDDSCGLPREITIPSDHFFVLGDNRPASDDSRFWGPVPEEAIIGVVGD